MKVMKLLKNERQRCSYEKYEKKIEKKIKQNKTLQKQMTVMTLKGMDCKKMIKLKVDNRKGCK